MVKESIKKFMQENDIPKDARFIVAVSGGADSIALLHAMKYLNFDIVALHCNFNLRGEESDRDEQFVKRFCHTFGIGLSIKKFDTKTYARERGIGIEMAARDLRYAWFREVKEKKNIDYIVTGHHADDLAETVFINLSRGTGIRGLTGIKAVNGDVLRPLLPCSRNDILQYVEENQIGFRNDSSNDSLEFTRNVIRHKVMPIFKEINPSFLHTIQENCKAVSESVILFEYALEQLKKEVVEEEEKEVLIDIQKTLLSPAPYTLLYEILKPFGFNKTQISDILESSKSTPGKKFLTDEYILIRGRKYWRLNKLSDQKRIYVEIAEIGVVEIERKSYSFSIVEKPTDLEIPQNPNIAYLDADKIKFPLIIRTWEKGDYFCPLGMKGMRKKLSDFFTDMKFTLKQKNETLLLESANQIAWVIGYRPDSRFKITPSTKRILIIEIK
ncbi:MAG: tRNA lysidine(34) synthetase TilS [Odoribacter sp.]|nr:tRNA lysidine(34) synthetase TilS [Odoribacter sp.]